MLQNPGYNQSAKMVSRSKTPSTMATSRKKSSERDTFDEVADMARSGYRLAKKIADLVNIETKCMFYGQTAALPAPGQQGLSQNWSSMTPVILNAPALGDLDFERISDSIKVQHLDFYLTLPLRNNATILPTFRLVIFWDETNGTTASNQVLEAGFFGSEIIIPMTKDWDEKASTKILWDRVYSPGQEGVLETGLAETSSNRHHRISLRIDKHTQFEQGTTTIVTGALKFFVVTDTSVAWNYFWQSRILYTDD